MNKGLLTGILGLLIFSSLVTASLYTEKIQDPSRFTSIEPIWSAELETTGGQTITVSVIEFKTLSYQGNIQKYMMFYLNDGTDEYIAEKGSYNWEREPHRTCESGFEECLNVCADGDESCADNCASSFNCETTYTCDTLAPDGSCGIQGADQDFGGHKLNLNFDPGTGQLNNFMNYLDSQSIGVTTQSGFLSEEVFRA